MADKRRNLGIPSGVVFPFAGTAAPYGYLMCFGQTLNISDYPALFVAIGTTYGGDGVATFILPDCRGRVDVGKDNMGGITAGRITTAGALFNGTVLGAVGGTQTHTLSSAQLAAHDHNVSDYSHTHTIKEGRAAEGGAGLTSGDDYTSVAAYIQTTSSDDHNHVVNDTGEIRGQAHQNTQPSIIFNKIIKI